jgi:hypothetical protein
MSGGCYNYAYSKVEDFAGSMELKDSPIRKAFKKHLELVATAMQAIEWVDDDDYSPGDEDAPILACLGESAEAMTLQAIIEDARRVNEQIESWLARYDVEQADR